LVQINIGAPYQIEQANDEAEAAAQQPNKSQGVPIENSTSLAHTIDRLNEQLATELGKNKRLKKKLDKLEKEHLPKLSMTLAGRSSYSKTDEDATFMRMKDDHLKNGQLKAALMYKLVPKISLLSTIRSTKLR
jgi:hypothetical protein